MKPVRFAAGLLSSGHLLNDFYCNFLPILLPIIMPRLGLSLTLSGLLVMVMSISSNMLQPVFGYFMDKYNFSKILLPVIPFGACCICAIGFVDTKFMLFILIALTGLSVSAFHPLGSTLVAKNTDEQHQGSAISYYIAGGNFGYAAAPMVLVTFTDAFPLTALPWLIIPSLILTALFAKSGLNKISTIKQQSATAAKPAKLTKLLTDSSVLKINISMGLRCWTHVSVVTFLPLLLISAGYAKFTSGVLLTIFLVGCTIGGLIGGRLGDNYSHKKIITISLFLAFFPTYYFFTHAGTEPLALIALFLSGAFILAPQPSSLVWAQQMMPSNVAMASGMMMGLSFGLGSIGTALTAAFADHIGLSLSLLLTSIPLLIAAVLAIMTPYQKK